MSDDEETPKAAPPAPPKSKLPLVLSLVTLLAAGAGGGWFFFKPKPADASDATSETTSESGDEHGKKPNISLHFLELNPPFTVNLADPDLMRYLQVDVQLAASKDSTLKAADAAMPMIRNRLMLLFAQQHYEGLLSREGKEALQSQALSEVNAILATQSGKPQLSALYFTGFIMQ